VFVRRPVRVVHCSGGAQDPFSEEGEASPAVHRALEELEPVDLALHLAVAPLEEHGREHGGLIAPDAGRERRRP
jgi:hypothetical protein